MPSDSEESDLGATRVLWNALLILAACLNSVDDLAELSKWFPLTADDIDDALKFAVTHESLEAVKLLLDLEIENNMDPVIHYEYVDDKRFINSLTHDGRPKMKELSFIDETIKRQSMSLLVYLTDRLSIRPVDYILANHREVGLKMIMSPNYPKELRDASIGGIIEFFDKVNELEGFGSPRYGQDDDDDDCKSYRQRTLRFLRKAVYNIGNLIEQGLYDPSLHDHACLRLAAVVDDTFILPCCKITKLTHLQMITLLSKRLSKALLSIVLPASASSSYTPKLRNPEVFKDFTERVLFTDPHRESRTQGHEPNRFVWIRRFLSNVDGISLQEFYDLLKLPLDYSRIKEDIDLISDLLMLVIRHRHTATTEHFPVNGVLVNVKDLDRHTAPLLLYKAFGRGLWEMEDLKNSADTMMAVETGLGRYGEDQLPLLRGI
ncbi:hypothetical protein BC829DRAFT_442750 [Chytridium lagenaria]|nr:hypothetical protein BC829DRAFT_442750 [Chytridium lagenaria]